MKNSHISARISFIFLKVVLKGSWISFNTKFRPQWKDLKSSYKVRQSLAPFCHLNSLILGQSSAKGLRVIKNDKEIKFEGVWREIESKQSFQRGCLTKHLRLTLVFLSNSAQRQNFNFCFQEFSSSINKTFIFQGRLATTLSFYGIYTLSLYFSISWHPKSYLVRQLVRQLVNTIFISNNRPSFHSWWNDNLVKHWKVSEYYETDCLQNFVLLFIFLLITKFVKNSHIQFGIFFIFLKQVQKQC